MHQIVMIPEWVGAAILGAIIAAVGYVAKLSVEFIQSRVEIKRHNRAKLVELRSLLRASKVAFIIQNTHARSLVAQVKNSIELNEEQGLEDIISKYYENFSPEQKEFHSLIRSMTTNALLPTNQQLLRWLREDTYFKGKKDQLAINLSLLESHIILWIAKYEAWIPGNQSHALIYLADEKKHGLGFPSGLDELVDKRTGVSWSNG